MKKLAFYSSLAISAFLVYCLFTSDGTYRLSKNFKYAYEQKAIFGEGKLTDVPPYVEFYCDDKNHILIKQKPHFNYDDMYEYNENYSYKNGLKDFYYWIIVKKTDEILGPLTKEEFEQSIKNLSISKKLVGEFEKNDTKN